MCIRDRFEEAEQGIGNLLLDKIGGPDNVAGLFEFGDYDPVSYTHLKLENRPEMAWKPIKDKL